MPMRSSVGVGIGAVRFGVTDVIGGDGLTVVRGQQIPPGAVIITVRHIVQNRAQRAGGVGVFLPAGDVAAGIVGPGPGLACRLVILPGQLVYLLFSFF